MQYQWGIKFKFCKLVVTERLPSVVLSPRDVCSTTMAKMQARNVPNEARSRQLIQGTSCKDAP